MGCNVSVAAINSMYEPQVISEDGYDKEEIQEARDYVEIKEVVEGGHQTDSYWSTSPNISE